MRWWGDPWPSEELRAPICMDDAERVPTPVGEPCLWCSELIVEGDRGEVMPYVKLNDDAAPSIVDAYMHVECVFRQGVGGPAHVQGTCTCQGGHDDPDLGMSEREAALWVWDHFTNAQTFHKYDDPPAEGKSL
jgi:hypothetical protein